MRSLGRIIGIAAACLLVLQLGGCSAERREAGYRERGARLLAEKNFEKARVELNNALQIKPRDARAHYLAAQVAEKLGNPRDALGHYQAAIDTEPSLAVARAGLARIYLYAGMTDKAMSLAEAGLKLSPDEPHLLTVRGAARTRLGNRAEGLKDAEAAARAIPEDEFVVALLSSLYAQDGHLDQAIEIATRAVEHAPSNFDLRYILADLLVKNHREVDAAAQLGKVVDLEPKVIAHRFKLAQFFLQQHDVDAAEQTLRQAVAAIPDNHNAKIALVQLLAQQRGAAAAEAQLRQFLSADPNNDDLRLSIADYERTKSAAEAEKLYQAVIAHAGTKPEGLTARVRLAALRVGAKDTAQAAKLLDEVLKKSPTEADALTLHGELAIARGDAPTAVTDLRTVLRDQPNNVEVMRTLAQAHQLNHETSLAEEVLRTALQVNPKDGITGLQLLQLLRSEGKQADASSLAQQLAKDQPGNPAVLEELFRQQLLQRDYKSAHDTVASLQQAHPQLSLGYYLAGLLDEAENHPDAALANYDRALKAQPDVVEPLTAAVKLQIGAKHVEQALARLDAVIAANPKHVVARNLKAEILVAQKRYDDGVKAYNELIAQAPDWWIPYRGLALTQTALKQPEAAIVTLTHGLQATGGAFNLTVDLGSLYEAQGRTDEAIKLYESFLQHNPRSMLAMNNLATLLASYRNDKASLDRATQLVASLTSINDPHVLDTRGWVAFRTGAYAQAVPLLQQALDKYPDSPLLHYRLGMAQLKSGHTIDAQRNLEVAVKSGQKFLGADEARATLDAIKG